ncbi:hypothetical protein HDU87_003263 [Geranomyces variabilis]|uniref:YncI copper-binding domain-containing protein n=1 Tax=Geranomyces variabilis TaxID=109894 RepID=A0AAD5TL77_9FUNG|nr:hypothetical protein HDU87_003263 [Geranomyces variabilis]
MHSASFLTLLALAVTAPLAVQGHASINPKVAVPASSVNHAIRIPHGCNGTATTRLEVTIPTNVTGLKPQQMPGWITNSTLTTISWSNGTLNAEFYMDFGIIFSTPAAADGSIIPFPTMQYCGDGSINNTWTGDLAPKLTLMRNGTLLKSEDFPLLAAAGGTANSGSGLGVNAQAKPNSAAAVGAWSVGAAALVALSTFSLV